MSTQLSLLKLSLSWSSFTFSALLFVCFSKSMKVQPRLISWIQKRHPFSHSEENEVLGVTGVLLPKSENLGPNAFCSSLHFTLEHFNCTAFQWKMLSRPKFANQREFSNKERPSESLGRLRLILRLIGEWRDATANPCLVAYQEKGLVSLFLSSLCLGISPFPLSIRKGIIPHSTCIRKK